ncbi:MAG: magnesium transporter [Gammaproteobacteria bacterium]
MSHDHSQAVLELHQQMIGRYPAEATSRLEELEAVEAARILGELPVADTINIWQRFSPEIGKRILREMPLAQAIEVMDKIEPGRAALLLRGQEPALINDLLAGVKPEIAEDIGKALAYPPDSAGALMDTNVIYFHPEMIVSAALARLRAQQRRGFRVVFVVDDDQHLVGMVEIQDLALADGNDRLIKLVRKIPALVSELTTKEEIVEILDRYRLTDLAVVDFGERLIGVVRYHALMDAAREESSADIQTMVGVSKDERAFSSVGFTVCKRLPWLHINLVTAFMAAAVVGIFEDTIAAYTALAVLLPVVAGQSGNAGAQALAVTMRGLALREARIRDWKRIVMKEFNVGLLNGIAVAITAAVCAGIWSGSVGIAIILSLSMIISLVIAGVTGAAIPILLTRFGQDPATASSIFLTTVTDVAGFFSFLGIATLLAGLL